MATGKTNPAKEPADRELVFTRIFDAPRELVFRMWTDPKRFAQWWGPHGFTNPVCELDLRPGGAIRVCMRSPEGQDYWMPGVFREIVASERLVFTTAVENEKGKWVLEVLNTVTFAEHGGKTKLTLRARIVTATDDAAPYLAGMEEGWTQSLDRLTAYLATG